MPPGQSMALAGMAQAAPAGMNWEQCRGDCSLPTAFMRVVCKGFLVSFHETTQAGYFKRTITSFKNPKPQ